MLPPVGTSVVEGSLVGVAVVGLSVVLATTPVLLEPAVVLAVPSSLQAVATRPRQRRA
jgi:hypothetical protein